MFDKKTWVSGQLPKRGSQPAIVPKPTGRAVAKLIQAQHRHRLGAPLAKQLGSEQSSQHRQKRRLMGVAVITAGLMVGVTALISHSIGSIWLGAGLLVAGGIMLRRKQTAAPNVLGALTFSAEVAVFDQCVASNAPHLPSKVLDALLRLKGQLKQVLVALQHPSSSSALHLDELFYVGQLMARYLPDTLAHYQAASQHATDDAAQTELLAQFAIMRDRLAQCLAALATAQQDKLKQHTTFLRQK